MNNDLFINSDVIAAIVGVILGTFISWLIQRRNEKQQKVELQFSKTTEQTFALLKKELKDKLIVTYNERKVDSLSYSRLEIKNTGSRTIANQPFTCSFPEDTEILTAPNIIRYATEVAIHSGEPLESEGSLLNGNAVMYRYVIEQVGVNQGLAIEFFANNNRTGDFKVAFGKGDQDVPIVEGATLAIRTLESHLWRIIIGVLAFFITKEVFAILDILVGIPYLDISPVNFEGIGTLLGLPFIFVFVIPSLKPVVSGIAERLKEKEQEATSGLTTLI